MIRAGPRCCAYGRAWSFRHGIRRLSSLPVQVAGKQIHQPPRLLTTGGRLPSATTSIRHRYGSSSADLARASPSLPDGLRQQYEEAGYVVIPNLLSHEQVDSLMDEMEAICRGERGDIPGVRPIQNKGMTRTEILKEYLCIHFPHKISPLVCDLTQEANTVAVLQQLLGNNIKCMQTMMFMKAGGKPGQACHQDEFYIPTRDRSLCASWIALDDVSVENGCIWVIPGSHRSGIIWPMKPHADKRFDSADVTYGHPYSESDFIPVELPSGSAVFFNGHLLHRSLPNSTKGFRRAFANHYMRAESFLPWTNDGRFDIKNDMRDFILVSGEDPYADFTPKQEITKPFLRGEAANLSRK